MNDAAIESVARRIADDLAGHAYTDTERHRLVENIARAMRSATAGYELALRNCLLLANRELFRSRRGGSLLPEMWGHVARICNEAGIRSNILRDTEANP